jgi:hypothetical protein
MNVTNAFPGIVSAVVLALAAVGCGSSSTCSDGGVCVEARCMDGIWPWKARA